MKNKMFYVLLLSVYTRIIDAKLRLVSGHSNLRPSELDNDNEPVEQPVHYIGEPEEDDGCDVILEDILTGKFKKSDYKGTCGVNKTTQHQTIEDTTTPSDDYILTTAITNIEDTLTTDTTIYDEGFTSSNLSYNDMLALQTPSNDDTLTTANPKQDDTLTSANLNYEDTLTTANPKQDDTLTTANLNYDDTLTAVTSNDNIATENKDNHTVSPTHTEHYDILMTSTQHSELTTTNFINNNNKPPITYEINNNAENSTLFLITTISDYKQYTINSEEYELEKKQVIDLPDDMIITDNAENYDDYTANLMYKHYDASTLSYANTFQTFSTAFSEQHDPKNETKPTSSEFSSTLLYGGKTTGLNVTMLDEDANGYWSKSLRRLCELIVLKEPQHVQPVLRHMKQVVQKMQEHGQLEWLRQPMKAMFIKISHLVTDSFPDELQHYARVLGTTLNMRHIELSPQTNHLIDLTDKLVPNPEGQQMLRTVEQLEGYPKEFIQNDYKLCESIVQAFTIPFQIRSTFQARDELVKLINKALEIHYPTFHNLRRKILKIFKVGKRGRNNTARTHNMLLRRSDYRRTETPEDAVETRQLESLTDFIRPFREEYRSPRRIFDNEFTKKSPRSKSRFFVATNREVMPYRISFTRQMAKNTKSNLRFIKKEKNIDSEKAQKRFHIVSQFSKPTFTKQSNLYVRRTTKLRKPLKTYNKRYKYFNRRTTRLNGNFRRIFTSKKNLPKTTIILRYNNTRKPLKDICFGDTCRKQNTDKEKIIINKRTNKTHKRTINKHLHKIIYESSYSDEENVLKINLLHNLRHYNHTYTKL